MTPFDANSFEDRKRLVYDDGMSPHHNVWFAYWLCSVPDWDLFLEGRLPRNTDFETAKLPDWFTVMTFQYDREDQSCDSGNSDDVSASGERGINGLRPLAPVQHYPFISQSVMSSAIGMAGTPQVCLHETWTVNGQPEFKRAMLGWRSPSVGPAQASDSAFDARLRRLLGLEPSSSKVLMVIRGYGAPIGEFRAESHRRSAWENFGFPVNLRTPTLHELHPGPRDSTAVQLPSLADLIPSRLWSKPRVLDPHHFLFLCLAEPLEAGSLTFFLNYWAAIGLRFGKIPAHLGSKALYHSWVTDRTLETIRRYVAGGLMTVGHRRSFYHDSAEGGEANAGPLDIHRSVREMSGDLTEILRSVAQDIEEVASSGASKGLKRWGVCLTEKGWTFRLSLEPQREMFIKKARRWGEDLPFDLFD